MRGVNRTTFGVFVCLSVVLLSLISFSLSWRIKAVRYVLSSTKWDHWIGTLGRNFGNNGLYVWWVVRAIRQSKQRYITDIYMLLNRRSSSRHKTAVLTLSMMPQTILPGLSSVRLFRSISNGTGCGIRVFSKVRLIR